MPRFAPAFQKMVDLATAQGVSLIVEVAEIMARTAAADGFELTREFSLARSANLVAYEDLEGADACVALMDRLEEITTKEPKA